MTAPSFRPGERLGDLEIQHELGRGAFAVVYLAKDTVLARPVALKVLAVGRLSDSAEERQRLLQEARIVARLQSPHIVPLYRVHDLGAAGLALEMEHMEGGSLADVLRARGRLPPDEATAHLRALLSALEVAHALGVVHRDVKPENLLFTARGELKLADFGLGRQAGEASLSGAHAKRVLGTPLYMSPEVVAGERATPASDLWSAGVVLHQMLAGRLPFPPGNLPALFYAIHHEMPEPLGAEHPPHLARLVARCLEKDPARRPESARAMLRELAVPRGGVPSPSDAGPVRGAPLGRERELETLDDAVARAEAGRGCGVLLLGEAGVGKSTLLEETARRARTRGFRVLDVALTPLGGLQRPLLVAVRRLFTSESAGSAWAGQLTSARFGAATPLLRGLLLEDAFEVQSRQQLVWAVECLLRGLAGERPVALVVEDLQFGDVEDLRALGEIVRRLADARACTLAAYRTHDPASSEGTSPGTPAMAELSATPGLAAVHVGPLPEAALVALAAREAGVERLAPEVRERIRDQSEGNALYALELVRHLLAEGAVEARGARLERAPRWNDAALPHRLSELVSIRLQRLTEEQRSLLDAAAVDGVTFDGGAVAQVLGLGLLPVLRSLQQLTREQGLIVPQRQGYRFSHTLFRDVIYRELAPDLRRHLHRALAEHLEAQGVAQTDPERAGTHWEQAGEGARARPLLRQAALLCARCQDYTRALDLAHRGGVALAGGAGPVDPLEGDLLLALAGCLSDLGRTPEAEALVARLERGAREAGDERLRLRAVVWRNDLAHFARGAEAIDDAELADAAQRLAHGYECGRAHWLLGFASHTRGALDEAERRFRLADPVYEAAGRKEGQAQVLHLLGDTAVVRNDVATAIECYERSARLMEALGRRADAAISRIMASQAALQDGRIEGVRTTMRAGVRELETTGPEGRAAHACVFLAKAEVAEGAYASALALLTRALQMLDARELVYGRLDALQELSALLVLHGRSGEASAHLEEARRLAVQGQYTDSQAVLAALHVKCLLLAGDPAGARGRVADLERLLAGPVTNAGAAEALLVLGTCAPFGLAPASGWQAFVERARALPQDATARSALALLGAARALADGADGRALRAAAEEVRAARPGVNRAEVLLLADCLEAEGRARGGDGAGAETLRRQVREAAARLPYPALARLAT